MTLLELVKAHPRTTCEASCPDGQSFDNHGHCVPTAILASAARPRLKSKPQLAARPAQLPTTLAKLESVPAPKPAAFPAPMALGAGSLADRTGARPSAALIAARPRHKVSGCGCPCHLADGSSIGSHKTQTAEGCPASPPLHHLPDRANTSSSTPSAASNPQAAKTRCAFIRPGRPPWRPSIDPLAQSGEACSQPLTELAQPWALGPEPENDNGGRPVTFVMVALRGDHPLIRLRIPQKQHEGKATD